MDLDSVYLLCSVDKQTEAVHSRSPRQQCFFAVVYIDRDGISTLLLFRTPIESHGDFV
jgi:hypothetical protein